MVALPALGYPTVFDAIETTPARGAEMSGKPRLVDPKAEECARVAAQIAGIIRPAFEAAESPDDLDDAIDLLLRNEKGAALLRRPEAA